MAEVECVICKHRFITNESFEGFYICPVCRSEMLRQIKKEDKQDG